MQTKKSEYRIKHTPVTFKIKKRNEDEQEFFFRKHKGHHPEYLQCWLHAFQFYDETYAIVKNSCDDRDQILFFALLYLVRYYNDYAEEFTLLEPEYWEGNAEEDVFMDITRTAASE